MPVEAARFLGQATFGATEQEIDALTGSSYSAWLDEQIKLPQTRYSPIVSEFLKAPSLPDNGLKLAFGYAIWKGLSTAQDQLRQRVAFALSEIMVVSVLPGAFFSSPQLGPGYLDMLASHAFGNFRQLIEGVSLSPGMGMYLSHLKNRKDDPSTGRVPDENFAREIMQLFTIGLYKLNQDGTLQLDSVGKPVETYTNEDITGLAKVFTGLSWAGPDTSDARFLLPAFKPSEHAPGHQTTPMQFYPQFHSTAEKKFLGVTIPAQSAPDGPASLKIALDTLFNHPNVGPFIGKQLIQRLVTSNPTPAYVQRVAAVFTNNGKGVRGDLAAVVRAILLDSEARLAGSVTNTSGKLKEPVVRFVNWMRICKASSASGTYLLDFTDDPASELGQSPMYSPTVFNFFRPGYMPPNSKISAQNLLAPEFQITTESSVAGYLNFMRKAIDTGIGRGADIKASYTDQLALAGNPVALVDSLNLLFTAGRLNAAKRKTISDEVAKIANSTQADKLTRVKLATFLVMASPEYILQN
jgi:uncharacterized protein (DUF1800 family)